MTVISFSLNYLEEVLDATSAMIKGFSYLAVEDSLSVNGEKSLKNARSSPCSRGDQDIPQGLLNKVSNGLLTAAGWTP